MRLTDRSLLRTTVIQHIKTTLLMDLYLYFFWPLVVGYDRAKYPFIFWKDAAIDRWIAAIVPYYFCKKKAVIEHKRRLCLLFCTYTPSAPECLDTIGFHIGFIFRAAASINWWIAAIIPYYFCKKKAEIEHKKTTLLIVLYLYSFCPCSVWIR